MRGQVSPQQPLWYAIDIESLIASDHRLREVKRRTEAVLAAMDEEFRRAYSKLGRPSIPPEMLLKALLLQSLYTVRSERRLVEEIRVNLLYRWFLDLSLDAPVWDATSFTTNRERFEKHGLIRSFFDRVVESAYLEKLASSDHFTVDGTLIESYGSMKSFRKKDGVAKKVSDGSDDSDPGNPTVNFRGEKRSNETHQSLTDAEARLYRNAAGQQSRLCHSAHALMENRNGLLVDISVAQADGHAERTEALAMVRRTRERQKVKIRTLGMDAGYDAGPFLHALEHVEQVVPHMPTRAGKIEGQDEAAEARRRARRRKRNKGYQISQRIRKRVEEIFGWAKIIGGLRRARHVGRWKIGQQTLVVGAAYNLLRLARLGLQGPSPAAYA
jgi:transposase